MSHNARINKNGTIELLRFFFCMAVLMYHLSRDYHVNQAEFGSFFSFFGNGRSGVEFFFVLSGYFMARNVYKSRNDSDPVGISTVNFLYRKFIRVFPEYIIAVALVIVYILIFMRNPAVKILDRLPSLFSCRRPVFRRHISSVSVGISRLC